MSAALVVVVFLLGAALVYALWQVPRQVEDRREAE